MTVEAQKEERRNLSPYHGLWTLTSRELKKWYKAPVILLLSIIQPIFWIALFGKAMNLGSIFTGTSINLPGITIPKSIIDQIGQEILKQTFGTTDYFSFLAAGMLSFIVLFTSMQSGMSIVWDRRLGVLDRLLTTPVPRGNIIIAKVLNSVIRSLVQATIVLIVAVLLGMTFAPGINALDFLGVYAALFLMSFGLSSLFLMLALRASDWQSQMAIMNLLNLPLLFTSNAFYPIKSMPSWLKPIAYINPLTYSNGAIRGLLLGIQTNLTIDFLYLGLFALILSTIGILLSWKYLST
ncbi:ABC transporter permease [Sulfurisphaera ohwakuensis]|uniref:ABC-2 type transport system permease protein n=1 Tax=Sulfurisphaera ohwakuensis TaxID=69656 RepID=A0A650CID1_SULOH|nr:ABC transporter permease [Sulfurisphaera ohwakuensis]MBB5253839.1 ABC-2 type transport system permease protein [Sulfurisphaera ohwakuensis]QGR17488.1 multidrug ABC transporter permease [Sulfurisphaera ohwakuensis]